MFEILECKAVSDKVQTNNMSQFVGSISKTLNHFNLIRLCGVFGGWGEDL